MTDDRNTCAGGLSKTIIASYNKAMLSRLRAHAANRFFLITALLALLLGQGLRLCLHAPHAADADHKHSTALHLESNLLVTDNVDDEPGDQHMPLSLALVKILLVSALLAILTTFTLMLLPSGPLTRLATARNRLYLPVGIHRLRPPLRAPPL